MVNPKMVDHVVKISSKGYGAEQRARLQHHTYDFPEWYLKEIDEFNKRYRPIRWIPLDIPMFEIDNEEFLHIWDNECIPILRTRPDVAEPWSKDDHPLGQHSNYHQHQFLGFDFYCSTPDQFSQVRGDNLSWTSKFVQHPIFDKIIEQIFDTFPYQHIDHMYIWESVRDVYPHRDAHYYWDMPTELRIMLTNDNDKPTLYVADVDYGDINFIELGGLDTNTFCWSNGSQLHGSDFHGKRKHLICTNGLYSISKYRDLMERSIKKYKDKLNYELKIDV